MLEAAAERNNDMLDPVRDGRSVARPRPAADEAQRLIDAGARGFKFHPPSQGFYANDEHMYPLYEVHRGEQGPGAVPHRPDGRRPGRAGGGGGIRLKYGNPIYLDDVAVDFPDMPIIMAHPSFPWQDEALAVALHKPQVYIDLSGWSPKYFPPTARPVRQHVAQEQSAVRLGSPDDHHRSLAGRFRAAGFRERSSR